MKGKTKLKKVLAALPEFDGERVTAIVARVDARTGSKLTAAQLVAVVREFQAEFGLRGEPSVMDRARAKLASVWRAAREVIRIDVGRARSAVRGFALPRVDVRAVFATAAVSVAGVLRRIQR